MSKWRNTPSMIATSGTSGDGCLAIPALFVVILILGVVAFLKGWL